MRLAGFFLDPSIATVPLLQPRIAPGRNASGTASSSTAPEAASWVAVAHPDPAGRAGHETCQRIAEVGPKIDMGHGILMTLVETGPLGQQEVSGLIGIDARNVVPIIDRLVDVGLVGREVQPTDRRRRVLALTQAGQRMVDDLSDSGTTMEKDFLRALTADEKKALRRMLLRVLHATTAKD